MLDRRRAEQLRCPDVRLGKKEMFEKKVSDSMKLATIRSTKSSEPLELFEYWIAMHKANSRRKPMFDAKREKLLAVAIYDYGLDYCKQAVEGCLNSHFHMGRNNRGRVYNSIELIFRDSEHIERFAGYMQ
jgi:hypothetical protein